ncbi:hypothetical protein ACOMHN_030907 [Nucella lapillus]
MSTNSSRVRLKAGSSTSSGEDLSKVNIADLMPGGKMPYLQPIKTRPLPKDGIDRFARSFLHTHRQAEKTRKLLLKVIPMWPRSYVATVRCGHGPMWPRSDVTTALCGHGPMCPWCYVPRMPGLWAYRTAGTSSRAHMAAGSATLLDRNGADLFLAGDILSLF